MRTILTWCLERKSVVILGTILVLLAGSFGATQLRQQLFPDLDFPFMIVRMDTPGLNAEAVDEQVNSKLDVAARQVSGVDKVFTIAREGEARLYVQLEFGASTADAEDEFTDALRSLDLPDSVGEPEFEGGFDSQAVLTAALVSDDLDKLSETATEWKDDIEALEGVARVELTGGTSEQAVVELKPGALQVGITPPLVAGALRDAQQNTPAGAIVDNGQRVPVVVNGPGIADQAAVSKVFVGTQPLSQLATVSTERDTESGYARTNGKPSLSLAVYRTADANEVAVVDAVDEVLDDARKELGKKNVVTIYETASDVRKSIKGLVIEAGLGALMAVVVIFLFLRSGRATMVAAVSIPTSIVFGLLAGWALGLTLNIITLAGLTIAIGRVIDDGIVVLENVHKHLERGESRTKAVLDGTSEVSVAIASSTLATAAVFLPIGFVGGFISEIFLSFSIIVTCALLASFLVAITIIPVLCAMVLRPQDAIGREGTRLADMVTPLTRFGVRHRWIVIAIAIVAFIGTMGAVAAGTVPVQFLPDSGTQQIYGTVALPQGTDTDGATKLLAPLEEEISSIKGVEDYQLAYGQASLNFGDPAQAVGAATFFFTVSDATDADAVVTALRKMGNDEYPRAFKVQRIENGPPAGSFQASVESPDQASLTAASKKIVALLEKRNDATDVSGIAEEQPQLTVQVKPGTGVSPSLVSGTIGALSVPMPAGETDSGLPIIVRVPQALLSDVRQLSKLPLGGAPAAGGPLDGSDAGFGGGGAPAAGGTLGDVVTLERTKQPAIVARADNGDYTLTVSARMLGEDTNKTIKNIKADIKALDLGEAEVVYEGEAEFIADMFKDIGLAMLVAIILVYLILVIFFGSLGQPITILAPIMFSLIGSLLALVITGRALGLPAMIGQLLLIGIVVANSILIVDTALRLRRRGMARDDALIEAARLRVRPVLMTATATIAALTPLAIGISGEGGIISRSLGTVVIGGLLSATVLTLVIVPAVFTIFDRRKGAISPPPVENGGGDRTRSRNGAHV